ncbi:unnamed protein product, partial [Ectocarpus fasciculatus]
WRDDIVDPPSEFVVEIYNNTVIRYPMTYEHTGIKIWTDAADVSLQNNIVDKESGGNDTPNFVDDSRSMDNYVSGGFDAFIREARNRPMGTWDPIYSAASFNQFMREGYTPR